MENAMERKMDGTDGLQAILQSLPRPHEVRSFREQLRERLDKVTADDVEECRELFDILERMRSRLGLMHWKSLKGYVGEIPRCVKAVGGKGR
jgi:hypothetical protein